MINFSVIVYVVCEVVTLLPTKIIIIIAFIIL